MARGVVRVACVVETSAAHAFAPAAVPDILGVLCSAAIGLFAAFAPALWPAGPGRGNAWSLRMRQNRATLCLLSLLLLVATALIAHGVGPFLPAWSQTAKPKQGPAQKPAPPPQVHYGTQGLPRPVLDMREALLAAIESGDIE